MRAPKSFRDLDSDRRYSSVGRASLRERKSSGDFQSALSDNKSGHGKSPTTPSVSLTQIADYLTEKDSRFVQLFQNMSEQLQSLQYQHDQLKAQMENSSQEHKKILQANDISQKILSLI